MTARLESMRNLFLQVLGVAAVQACSAHPIGDSDSASTDTSSDASTASTVAADTTSPAPTDPTAVGDDSTAAASTSLSTTGDGSTAATTTTPDGLCEPEEDWHGILCVPKTAATCGPCDEACQSSSAAGALAEELLGACCTWGIELLCGPVEQDGECCYTVAIPWCGCEGRPLLVDGRPRVAARAARDDWQNELAWIPAAVPSDVRADAAARWSRAALDEHASIAAFARFALQLLVFAAPAALIADAHAALADEVKHARLSFAVATALADRPIGPGALPEALAELSADRVTFALEAFREGCVGESVAAAIAGLAAARCDDPDLRALLERIAADELRHAALAWRTLHWLLDQPGADTLRTAIAAVSPPYPTATDAAEIPALGRLSSREESELIHQLWHEVIAPCRTALLDRGRLVYQASAPPH